MTDFLLKGVAQVELFDRKYATDAWGDVDKDEVQNLMREESDETWKKLKWPQGPKFAQFRERLDAVCNSYPNICLVIFLIASRT